MCVLGFPVMYRSKDSTLPKLSAEDGPGGEVFFDVRSPRARMVFAALNYFRFQAKSPVKRWHRCPFEHSLFPVWEVFRIWHLTFGQSYIARAFLLAESILHEGIVGQRFLHDLRSSHRCPLGDCQWHQCVP